MKLWIMLDLLLKALVTDKSIKIGLLGYKLQKSGEHICIQRGASLCSWLKPTDDQKNAIPFH